MPPEKPNIEIIITMGLDEYHDHLQAAFDLQRKKACEYLQDIQAAVLAGRLKERKFSEIMERLLAVISPTRARKVLRQLDHPLTDLFTGLGHEKLAKVQVFIDKRLSRQL